MINNCPLCGAPLSGKRTSGHGSTFQSTKRLRNVATMAPPDMAPGISASRELPLFLPTVESNVTVPRAKAITSATFAGPFYGVIIGAVWYIGWGIINAAVHGVDSASAGQAIIIGLVSAAGSWFWIAWHRWEDNASYYDELLSRFEEVTGLDLNQDGQVGEPERPEPVRMEVINQGQDGFRQMLRFDLPGQVDTAAFFDFASGVAREGRGLAESQWIGKGKPFSRNTYGALLQVMQQAGVVRWVDGANHAAGRELTGSGRRALLQFVYTYEKGALTHSHSLDGGDESGYVHIEGVG